MSDSNVPETTEKIEMSLNAAFKNFLTTDHGKDVTGNRFVRHYIDYAGGETIVDTISRSRVESYVTENILKGHTGFDPNAEERVLALKVWFQFLKKKKYTEVNLGNIIRAPRKPRGAIARTKAKPNSSENQVTAEGFNELKQELENLQAVTPRLRQDVALAREDKDFRENAPLDAAREALAFNLGRITELTTILDNAVVSEEVSVDGSAMLGSLVSISNLDDEKQYEYTLVSAHEANPSLRKISIESPVGKELLHRRVGEEITVTAPVGKIRFRVEKVGKKLA
jgi:transcription elongation factor GreA